jgi:hypothetical protein
MWYNIQNVKTQNIGCYIVPSMYKVIFYCCFFDFFMRGQVFGFVPFKWGLPSLTFQIFWYPCMGDKCNFNCHLVMASMFKPIFSHQSTMEKHYTNMCISTKVGCSFGITIGQKNHMTNCFWTRVLSTNLTHP